jgi:zinc transporter ZupT
MIYLALILAVITGILIAKFIAPQKKVIQIFLSFSGAYLLSITVLHLLPEVFESQQKNIGLYILLGIVIQTILEYLSKGAEHGHVHAHDLGNHVPWLLFVSLSIHAFLEGVPLGIEKNQGLLWAIIIHKVPIAIILAVFFKNSNLSTLKVALFLSLFALMTPMGSWVAQDLTILKQYQVEINALVIGIFLHISTAILFESSENHQFNFKKFIAILIGFSIAFISSYLI